MIKLGELVACSRICTAKASRSPRSRSSSVDRKTVRTYIAQGPLEPPAYKKRAPAPA